MMRLTILLLSAVLASAFYLVRLQYQSRVLIASRLLPADWKPSARRWMCKSVHKPLHCAWMALRVRACRCARQRLPSRNM